MVNGTICLYVRTLYIIMYLWSVDVMLYLWSMDVHGYIYTEDNGDSPGLNGVNRTGDGVAEVQQYQYDLLRTFTL